MMVSLMIMGTTLDGGMACVHLGGHFGVDRCAGSGRVFRRETGFARPARLVNLITTGDDEGLGRLI